LTSRSFWDCALLPRDFRLKIGALREFSQDGKVGSFFSAYSVDLDPGVSFEIRSRISFAVLTEQNSSLSGGLSTRPIGFWLEALLFSGGGYGFQVRRA